MNMERKNAKANAEINMAATIAAAAGVANPIPLAGDVVALVAIWTGMLISTARIYEIEIDERSIRIALKQAWRSLGWYAAGTISFITIVKWTGVFTVPAAAANGALNAAFTKAVGHMYQQAWIEGWDSPSQEDLDGALKNAFNNRKAG